MLQSIRDRSQGFIAWFIIAFIALTFALWGIHNYFSGGGKNNNVVAKVNGSKITEGQVLSAYERMRRQQEAQLGGAVPTNPTMQTLLKQQVLKQLISNHVLSDAAFKDGYRVGQQQVYGLI